MALGKEDIPGDKIGKAHNTHCTELEQMGENQLTQRDTFDAWLLKERQRAAERREKGHKLTRKVAEKSSGEWTRQRSQEMSALGR